MFNDHQQGSQDSHPPGKTQIKRFVAPSMARALQLVRDEMGPEAVILSSQRTPQGVEVITSLEPDLPTRGIDVRREFGQNFDADLDHPMESDSAWKMQAGIQQAAANFKAQPGSDNRAKQNQRDPEHLAQEIERARERMLEAKRQAKEPRSEQSFHDFVKQQSAHNAAPVSAKQEEVGQSHYGPAAHGAGRTSDRAGQAYIDRGVGAADSYDQRASSQRPADASIEDDLKLSELKSELADMRLLLEQQLWRMNETQNQHSMPSQINLPVGYSVVGEHLKRLGLAETLVQELLQQQESGMRPNEAWKNSLAMLSRRVPALKNDLVSQGGVFAFVGPTGVGKTTTIAKLAARFVLEHGPGKVAIVTTDTYRVGAHDQLRSLGRILGVPVRAVDKDHSLPIILSSLKQFPLVLVDTAGFRQGDTLLKEQLRQLDTCPAMRRILVMACNSQLQTLKASTHAYSGQRGVDACVITKVDESLSMGEVLSVLVEKGLPVAYTTDGQEIPKDIAKASSHTLIAKAVALAKTAQQAQRKSHSMTAL